MPRKNPQMEAMLAAVLDNDLQAQSALWGERHRTTLPPVDDSPLMDAKLEAVEARTDAKFADLRTDLAAQFGDLKAELAKKPATGTLIGTAVAIVALILSALAFGGDRLALGIGLADQRQEQLKRDQAQDEKLDRILDRLPPTPSNAAAN